MLDLHTQPFTMPFFTQRPLCRRRTYMRRYAASANPRSMFSFAALALGMLLAAAGCEKGEPVGRLCDISKSPTGRGGRLIAFARLRDAHVLADSRRRATRRNRAPRACAARFATPMTIAPKCRKALATRSLCARWPLRLGRIAAKNCASAKTTLWCPTKGRFRPRRPATPPTRTTPAATSKAAPATPPTRFAKRRQRAS